MLIPATCTPYDAIVPATPSERVVEERVLVGRADRDADRGRRAEAGERAHDHALLEQALEERRGVLAEVDVDEVADRVRRRA